ncbi:AraC family transcriptional regulator, partial [Lactococcus garvieae]|uniref:AraC family transcriptional regulator n=1 Tax=Lactococcus garvieae TaxID=1363 RepID=UPI0025517E07
SIPIIIFDEKSVIIYPKSTKKDLGDLNIQLLDYYKANNIVLIEKCQKVYSVFGANIEDKEHKVILGPQYALEVKLQDSGENYIEQTISKRSKDEKSEFIKLTKYIFSIFNDKVPQKEVLIKQVITHEAKAFNKKYQENLEDRRKEDVDNDSSEIERRILQAIVSNNREEFDWLFGKVQTVYFIRLHSNRLISLKYKYVAFITLLTRVSINNGVSIKRAYSLSDTLIQELEFINSLQDCIAYFKESCLQFMKLIYISKSEQQNKLVKDIKEYITMHLNQRVTIDQLAEYFNMSTSHISSEFKKCTKMTIHVYILNIKLEEVKKLLVGTNLDICSIAQRLGFADQSHLNRTFKRKENITPKQYRKKYQSTRIL